MEAEESSAATAAVLQGWELVPKSKAVTSASSESSGTLVDIESDSVGIVKSDHFSLGFPKKHEEIAAEFSDFELNISQYPNWIDPIPCSRTQSGDFLSDSSSYMSEIPSTDQNNGNFDNFGEFWDVLETSECDNKVLDYVESEVGLKGDLVRGIGNKTREMGDLVEGGCFSGVEKNKKNMVRWISEDLWSDSSRYPSENGTTLDNSENSSKFCEISEKDHCQMQVEGVRNAVAVMEGGGRSNGMDKNKSVMCCKSGDFLSDSSRDGSEDGTNVENSENINNFGEFLQVLEKDQFNNRGMNSVESEERMPGEDGISFNGIFKKFNEKEEKKNSVVWWKTPLEFVRLCVARVGPIWVLSGAAAVVGFIFLKRRLYKMKQRIKALELTIAVDDNKRVSHFVDHAARLNDAFSAARRLSSVRPALPVVGLPLFPVPG